MPEWSPPKSIRCRFFDSEGRRIHGGCSRRSSTCHFIHPSDPEWSDRRSTRDSSPRRSPASSSSYHGYERRRSRSTDRQRTAPESDPKRRRTPPRGSSGHYRDSDRKPDHQPRSPRRGESPPRDRSSFSTTRDVRPLPHRSSSHDRRDSYPQPDLASKDASIPTQPKMGNHSVRRPIPSSKNPALATAATIPMASTSTIPTDSAKVPSRSFSDVLPPPPSLNSASLKDEMTPEQRRAVWEKRVALMADATQEYMDLGKLEKDVEARRRQVQSPAFDTLPSDIRDAFHTGLTNATATYEKKKASLNKALKKLSETDFWPSMPSQNVGDMEAKLKEAKTMLGGLADSVGQLYKRIESLYEQRTSRPSAGSSTAAADEAAAGDEDTHNKKKRRRLSDDASDTAADAASPDMREDVESIRDAIREIEDRIQEMENDVTQHSRNILEELEVKLDEKIEEIARSADISTLVGGDQLGPQTAQTIQTFHENYAQADREIAELAQEVADLLPQLDTLQRENDRTRQEEATEKELFDQLVKADRDNAEAIARLQEEAKALRKALTETAHAEREAPVGPTMPPSGSFIETVKQSIATQVQAQLVPLVAQTRTEMERFAKSRDTELYEKLRDRIDQSLKMSQLISTWIEHNPDDARQALATAAAGVQLSGAGSSGSVVT